MGYKLVQTKSDNYTFIFKVFVLFIVYVAGMLFVVNKSQKIMSEQKEKFTNNSFINKSGRGETHANPNDTDMRLMGSYGLGKCSQNCCATQYDTSIEINDGVKKSEVGLGKKYSTSNLMCSNGVTNRGCVCIEKNFKNKNNYPLKQKGLLNTDNNTISAFKKIKNKSSDKNVKNVSNKEVSNKEIANKEVSNKEISNKDVSNKEMSNTDQIVEEILKKQKMPINSNEVNFDFINVTPTQVNALNKSNISGNEVNF